MTPSRPPVIAIDGPSASGKGTVATLIAKQLGYHFLDSGALYRLTALATLRAGLQLDDIPAIERLAATLPAVFHGTEILLDGECVTDTIRDTACTDGSSRIAIFPGVRAALLERQRAYRQLPGLVADGRDMGSVVFPDAHLKIFLTASTEARAERRYNQLIKKGMSANIMALLQDLHERDVRDSARNVAPLLKCVDAVLLDTTHMSIDQAVQAILDLHEERLARLFLTDHPRSI